MWVGVSIATVTHATYSVQCNIWHVKSTQYARWTIWDGEKNLLIALKLLFWQTMTWYGIRLWISSIFVLFQSFSLFEFCQTLIQCGMKFQIYLLLYSFSFFCAFCQIVFAIKLQRSKIRNWNITSKPVYLFEVLCLLSRICSAYQLF